MPVQQFQNLPLQVTYSVSRRGFYYLTQSRFRGVIAAFFLSVGGLLASSLLAGARSSYICPVVTNGASRLQSIKAFNLLADSALLIGIAELCRIGGQFDDARRKRALVFLGAGLLVSSIPRDPRSTHINNLHRVSLSFGVFSRIGCPTVLLSLQDNPCWTWSTLAGLSASPF